MIRLLVGGAAVGRCWEVCCNPRTVCLRLLLSRARYRCDHPGPEDQQYLALESRSMIIGQLAFASFANGCVYSLRARRVGFASIAVE